MWNHRVVSQSFSGTDLQKKKDDVGIVFPLAKPNKPQLSVSSIVEHDKKEGVELACSEARLATLDKNSVVYLKGHTNAFVARKRKVIEPSIVGKLFGIEATEIFGRKYYIGTLPIIDEIGKIIEHWEKSSYLPSVEFVKEENLSKQKPTFTYKSPFVKNKEYLPSIDAWEEDNGFGNPIETTDDEYTDFLIEEINKTSKVKLKLFSQVKKYNKNQKIKEMNKVNKAYPKYKVVVEEKKATHPSLNEAYIQLIENIYYEDSSI